MMFFFAAVKMQNGIHFKFWLEILRVPTLFFLFKLAAKDIV